MDSDALQVPTMLTLQFKLSKYPFGSALQHVFVPLKDRGMWQRSLMGFCVYLHYVGLIAG